MVSIARAIRSPMAVGGAGLGGCPPSDLVQSFQSSISPDVNTLYIGPVNLTKSKKGLLSGSPGTILPDLTSALMRLAGLSKRSLIRSGPRRLTPWLSLPYDLLRRIISAT